MEVGSRTDSALLQKFQQAAVAFIYAAYDVAAACVCLG